MRTFQKERPFARDPETQVIRGAEPFDLGHGSHAVLFLHGWTSSPRELRFTAERLAGEGFHCRGLLLRGHGLTARAIRDLAFRDYLDQALEAFGELALRHDRVSVCGLSAGGLLALHLAARCKVANLVLFAPFLFPVGNTLGLIPNRWLVRKLPEFIETLGKNLHGPILDPAALEAHIAYHEMPVKGLMSLVEGAQRILPVLPKIEAPTLIVHSQKDRTADFAGTVELLQRLGSSDKTLITLNRSDHVITLDHDRARVEEETSAWLGRRR